MVETGEKANRKTIGIITGMDQPLGNAVGNSLEIIESIEALKGNGPDDLMEVCFAVAGSMLTAGGVTGDPGAARELLTKALYSGEALIIFRKFITAQGGDARVCENYSLLPQSKYRVLLKAESGGFISEIDALEVGLAAVDIGAGRRKKEDSINHAAGFVFNKKVGDRVKTGEPIVTVHTGDLEKAEGAKERLKRAVVISSGRRPQPSPPAHVVGPEMIYYYVDKNGISSKKDWSGGRRQSS
jgi:pyrimidine-nucleoside phosphorylase